MISHMLGEILGHADHIAVMRDGTVVADGPTAIGQNRRAARLAGIDVARIRYLTYVLCGALGGLNGALPAGYFRGASVDLGNDCLPASIAVVVIGGTSVAGGEATVAKLWGAALFLIFLQIMLNAGLRLVVTGPVIVAAPGARPPLSGGRLRAPSTPPPPPPPA